MRFGPGWVRGIWWSRKTISISKQIRTRSGTISIPVANRGRAWARKSNEQRLLLLDWTMDFDSAGRVLASEREYLALPAGRSITMTVQYLIGYTSCWSYISGMYSSLGSPRPPCSLRFCSLQIWKAFASLSPTTPHRRLDITGSFHNACHCTMWAIIPRLFPACHQDFDYDVLKCIIASSVLVTGA